nr:glycoside hydrolase family 66 protein [Clostridium guangxiense]
MKSKEAEKVVDIFPLKSQYKHGEKVEIKVEINDYSKLENSYLLCKVYRLNNIIITTRKEIEDNNETMFEIYVSDSDDVISGYGVEVELYSENVLKESAATSFDIVHEWYDAPRYGFISDFSKNDLDDSKDVEQINKYHINVVQFYDWMYRHHKLNPPQSVFNDPLGRELSMDVVEQKIDYCHKYGMKALAYGAVYGSEKEFFEEHKEMAMYKNDGNVLDFANFIFMMDINRKNPWHDHIINEFYEAVKLGFDGIHMDQYGFPKEAVSKINNDKSIRHLREDFPKLIDDTRAYIEEKGYKVNLIFNAVNNWPIDTVACSNQDCMYIEVWPPNITYGDLYNLINNAKRYEPKKQVILAAYMKPFNKEENTSLESAENATIMTMATIFASGGFHLLLGEKNGVLTEGYYPNYAVVSESFSQKLRKYYDFIVRYEELLFDFNIVDDSMTYTGGINGEYVFNGCEASPKAERDKVWTLIKEKPGYKIINLVNFAGYQNMGWNEGKANLPYKIEDIEVTALVVENVKGVYVASPDYETNKAQKLEYECILHEQGKAIKFKVPTLKVWDLIYIEV